MMQQFHVQQGGGGSIEPEPSVLEFIPTTKSVPSSANSTTVELSAEGLTWALTYPSWLTVVPSTSTGSRLLTITATKNLDEVNPRIGTITAISGALTAVFTLTQAKAEVTVFTLTPATRSLTRLPQTTTTNLSAVGLAWTINSNVAWLIPTPVNGSGNSVISIAVAQNDNTGNPRIGTITASSGGRTTTTVITQAAQVVLPSKIAILIGYTPFNTYSVACSNSASNSTSVYVDEGTTLMTTSKLYADGFGNVLAPTGWYSNGPSVRYWSFEENRFGLTSSCSGFVTFPITLGYSINTKAEACQNYANNPEEYQSLEDDLFGAISIYPNEGVTGMFARSGWYSDGTIAREWDSDFGFKKDAFLADLCG